LRYDADAVFRKQSVAFLVPDLHCKRGGPCKTKNVQNVSASGWRYFLYNSVDAHAA
jgi:hypothetical protein